MIDPSQVQVDTAIEREAVARAINSALVAFSNARKDLGLRKSRKPKSKKIGTSGVPANPTIEILNRAKQFVEQCGSPERAVEAIEELKKLQV